MLTEGLNQPNLAWINDTHWVDHPITQIPDPPKKKRRLDDFSKPHVTGSARCVLRSALNVFSVLDPDQRYREIAHPFGVANSKQEF
jgi:hypothetical protein